MCRIENLDLCFEFTVSEFTKSYVAVKQRCLLLSIEWLKLPGLGKTEFLEFNRKANLYAGRTWDRRYNPMRIPIIPLTTLYNSS